VSRDGHININQAERLVGLRAVNAWIDRGRDALPKPENNAPFLDVTKVPEPVPSRVFVTADQRGFTAHVLEVTDVFGNLLLDIQAADFAAIGLVRGAYVEMTINEKPFRVLYGKDFSSVKRGEWVVFENADGFYWLGRNGLSAASATDAQIGDLVHVRRYDSATAVTPKR
jgi:S-adenosylmethionine hydrolase